MTSGISARVKLVVAVAGIAVLSGCTAQYRTHGYVPPEEELQQIVPGIDTRASVEDTIGVPTTASVRTEGGIYYVESQVRHFAWRRPEVIDRTVLAITFDETGVVDNVVTYGLEDGQVVPLVRRVTQSSDRDIGFIRKLFGNIGGLNASELLTN
ncbi:outer membrane protein assembly factor BamE [Thalassococcus sp. CAU 1522]|uniref:Outer membrane protein assembly factor BamE n=1 Tax=Thalassococcus arenae TaxID=2851652 RepID=A0ABS6N9S3_9RHOB|nr:outer membrane protein assembly factor BamE [Thalassococcus arenae]MBV2360761.1 outer membrane protein assembly factor BamE [Thalassococcus arenae]